MESSFLKALQIVAEAIIFAGMICVCWWVVLGINTEKILILIAKGDIALVHRKLNFAAISIISLTILASLFILAEIIKVIRS